MNTKNAVLGVGALVLALLACKDKKDDTPAASAAPVATPAAPAPEATTAAPAPERPAAPDVDAKGIPAIPGARSNPPSAAEWSSAVSVNTQEANSQAHDCSMKIVREWIKVHCEGDVKSISDKDGLPKSSADYFESIQLGKFADFVFRLQKGRAMKMRIHRDGNRASLFINWPGSADRPVNVALAQIKE